MYPLYKMDFVVPPKCPICKNIYTTERKPFVLQPCGHGLCKDCIKALRDHEGENCKCPQCRETIIEEKPNFELIELLPDLTDAPFYTDKLLELTEIIGAVVTIGPEVEMFSKLIVDRIAYKTQIIEIPHSKRNWTETDKKVLKRLVLDIKGVILVSEIEFTNIVKWVEVLSFPEHIETYLVSKTVQLFEKKNFLKLREAIWLMEIIPITV